MNNYNSKEPLVEPFIHYGYGTCPMCGGGLVLADSELTLMELNKDGIPISYEETVIHCKARCIDCGFQQNMIRWEDGYIPDNKRLIMLKKFEVMDRIRNRYKDYYSNKNNKDQEENPFI